MEMRLRTTSLLRSDVALLVDDDGSLEQLTEEDLRRSWRDPCLMQSPLLSVVVVVVVLVRLVVG